MESHPLTRFVYYLRVNRFCLHQYSRCLIERNGSLISDRYHNFCPLLFNNSELNQSFRHLQNEPNRHFRIRRDCIPMSFSFTKIVVSESSYFTVAEHSGKCDVGGACELEDKAPFGRLILMKAALKAKSQFFTFPPWNTFIYQLIDSSNNTLT